MQPSAESSKIRIDWRWVGLGYCFFVVFHLLPSYLFNILSIVQEGSLVLSFWLLAGLVLIGVYIGYRSTGYTILEPAIAALLYTITIFLRAGDFWGETWNSQSAGMLFVGMVAAFLLAMLGAWIGEKLQVSKEQRVSEAES